MNTAQGERKSVHGSVETVEVERIVDLSVDSGSHDSSHSSHTDDDSGADGPLGVSENVVRGVRNDRGNVG